MYAVKASLTPPMIAPSMSSSVADVVPSRCLTSARVAMGRDSNTWKPCDHVDNSASALSSMRHRYQDVLVPLLSQTSYRSVPEVRALVSTSVEDANAGVVSRSRRKLALAFFVTQSADPGLPSSTSTRIATADTSKQPAEAGMCWK